MLFLTQTAFFGIIAAIVKLFEFPVFFVPGFYKLNFSEAVALIGGFWLGPAAGIMIELIKTILFFLFRGTSTFFIGEAASFIIGCAFVLPCCIVYKKNRTLKGAIHGMFLGIISLMIISGTINYFVLLPLYLKLFGISIQNLVTLAHQINPLINDLFTFIIFAVVPFNFLKGFISCSTAIVLYKKTSRITKRLAVKTLDNSKLKKL